MSDLDDVLEGEEATGEELASSPEEETEQAGPTEEAAEEKPTEEPDASIQEDKEQEGLKAAIAAERRRRQEAEQRIAEFEQKAQESVEKPDFWEDPESVIQERMQSVERKFENRFLNMSEHSARARHKDFDDVASYFFDELAAQNPALAQEALQAPDPYEHIYQTASKHKLVNDIGDIESYKSKLRAEIAQELEAEKKAAIEQALKTKSELPGTLSKESAASSPASGAEYESLEDLMGR